MGLTTLGVFHTAIALIGLAAGFYALAQYKEIRITDRIGQIYVVGTFIAAATGLGIFQHGGFGPPHVLSILTIIALAVGTLAGLSGVFGAWSRYVQAISFTTTILFHLIPAITETTTRLPAGAPIFSSPDDPGLKPIAGLLLVIYAIGLTLQIRWMRASSQR
jgi:uncharacterized membrane protein